MEFPCGACICNVIVAEIYPPDITVIITMESVKHKGSIVFRVESTVAGADTDILYLPLFLLCHTFIKGVA